MTAKRNSKWECKFECKLKPLLDSGYERDIYARTRTDVDHGEMLYVPLLPLAGGGINIH